MSISHIICQYILVFKCCPLRVEEIFALKIKIVSFLKAIKTKISWGERGKMWYPRLQTFFVCMLSCVRLFATPWTVAQQAPLSVGFPGMNTRMGCHFLLQGMFPTQESNLRLLHLLPWQEVLYDYTAWKVLKHSLLKQKSLLCLYLYKALSWWRYIPGWGINVQCPMRV